MKSPTRLSAREENWEKMLPLSSQRREEEEELRLRLRKADNFKRAFKLRDSSSNRAVMNTSERRVLRIKIKVEVEV